MQSGLHLSLGDWVAGGNETQKRLAAPDRSNGRPLWSSVLSVVVRRNHGLRGCFEMGEVKVALRLPDRSATYRPRRAAMLKCQCSIGFGALAFMGLPQPLAPFSIKRCVKACAKPKSRAVTAPSRSGSRYDPSPG